MSITIYTLAGCIRCKIAKKIMSDNDIDYEEIDMMGEGKDVFAKFYRENRSSIARNERGVRLPIIGDGQAVRQGLPGVLAYVLFGTKLDGYVSLGVLEKEWCDGLSVSGGDPAFAAEFIELLQFLKKNQFKLQLYTDGRNSALLAGTIEKGLCDKVLMEVKCPLSQYTAMYGEKTISEQVRRSVELVAKVTDKQFYTGIAPVSRPDGSMSLPTIEEISEIAAMMESASGSKKNPYILKYEEGQNQTGALAPELLFKYRTAARRYQVMTELQKSST